MLMSHPTRGEWIEICEKTPNTLLTARLTPHGVSGLKYSHIWRTKTLLKSHPTRGEWIEI